MGGYTTTKSLLTFLAVSAWLAIVASLFLGYKVGSYQGFVFAIAGTLTGLTIVVICQLGSAVISSAENTAELVKLAKEQNKIALSMNELMSEQTAATTSVLQRGPGSRVKVYRGYEITKVGDAEYQVAGENFPGVIAAEKHVNKLIEAKY